MDSNITLNYLIERSFQTAVSKGFHDEPLDPGDAILLMISELTEAFEELRDGHTVNEVYSGKGGKPEGLPIELADCVIRIADFCGANDIDLGRAILTKMKFNETRPHKHGKAF